MYSSESAGTNAGENTDIPYNDLPRDLPHAGRIALRLCRVLANRAGDVSPVYETLLGTAGDLNELLFECRLRGEEPSDPAQCDRLAADAAALGRALTGEIEARRLCDDRVGQCVRNLFECLGLGREGAVLSLRAGEHPDSLQRPC